MDDKLVGKQEDTFLLDILMKVVRLQGMPRLERLRLGLQMVLDDGHVTHEARFTQLQAPEGKTLHAACLILY